MKKIKFLIIAFLLGFLCIITCCSGCKSGATIEETKVLRSHSNLCMEEIHKNWKYYTDEEREMITSRFMSINKLFKAILEEKGGDNVTPRK